MPSEANKLLAEQLTKQQTDLKLQYQELGLDHPVIADLLDTVKLSYEAAHAAALNEVDNPARAVAALQQANAYDKIRSYITSMMV